MLFFVVILIYPTISYCFISQTSDAKVLHVVSLRITQPPSFVEFCFVFFFFSFSSPCQIKLLQLISFPAHLFVRLHDLAFSDEFVLIFRLSFITGRMKTRYCWIFLYSQRSPSQYRFHLLSRKITELEEELRVVGNNMKSLEVSEQEVTTAYFMSSCIICRIFQIYFSTTFFPFHYHLIRLPLERKAMKRLYMI